MEAHETRGPRRVANSLTAAWSTPDKGKMKECTVSLQEGAGNMGEAGFDELEAVFSRFSYFAHFPPSSGPPFVFSPLAHG